MKRDVRTPGWKAMLAVSVAGGGLLWHILACTESPMAFSPGGKELAFVTAPLTVKSDDDGVAARRPYRLIIVSADRRARIIEETDRHMLSAPAYSPRGNYLCYFRVALPDEREAKELAAAAKKRAALLKEALSLGGSGAAATQAATWSATQPFGADASDEGPMPPPDAAAAFYESMLANPRTPVTLVVRDALAPEVIIATVRMELPLLDFTESGDPARGLLISYGVERPQWTPDGKSVCFCLGNVVGVVNPRTGARRILAAPAMLARLSPDGQTLAWWHGNGFTFLKTDGSRATHVRWKEDFALGSVAWVDNKTLALLTKGGGARVVLLDAAGGAVRSRPVLKGLSVSTEDALALSPDGKHMVLAREKALLFLDAAGKVLRRIEHEDVAMAQPTFTPDGRRVAVKFVEQPDEDGPALTTAIVFFSPDGRQLGHAKIPLPKWATSRPASRPATAPATAPASRQGEPDEKARS